MNPTVSPPGTESEDRLSHCARCGEWCGGAFGHPLYGIVMDDLGSVPMFTIMRTLGRTHHMMIRLRICNECYAEALAFAEQVGGPIANAETAA